MHKQTEQVDYDIESHVAQHDALVQRGFLRKVFGLVAAQLLATALLSAAVVFVAPLRAFAVASPFTLLFSAISSFGFLFACHVNKDVHPKNLYLLGGFTLSMGWSIATISAQYYERGMGRILIEAILLTGLVVAGLTLYTLRSKKDFSFMGAGLGASLWALILGGMFASLTGAPMVHLMYSVAGAVIFSLYIVYDVYLISKRFSADEYIAAAISLYLDILNLFLNILRILSELNRNQ